MRLVLLAAVAVMLSAGTAARASAADPKAGYEDVFARSFPANAGQHRVADWKLYAALADGDLIAYATRVDPELGKRLADAHDKGYQRQQLEAGIKDDQRLRAVFAEQRQRVRSMALYVDDASAAGRCERPLVFIAGEFRVVLGATPQRADPLASATVAPGCATPLTPVVGFQLTASQSPRFRCWPASYEQSCGWRLTDMPAGLKQVIENDYPKSITLRWRWHGLGNVTQVRLIDANGNPSSTREHVAVTTPLELGLEFVDAKGQVLWTAATTPPSHAAAPPARGRRGAGPVPASPVTDVHP